PPPPPARAGLTQPPPQPAPPPPYARARNPPRRYPARHHGADLRDARSGSRGRRPRARCVEAVPRHTSRRVAIMKMSELFDPEPRTWGLRGDPYLWRALREHLSGADVPGSAGDVVARLHAAFSELVGVDLASDPASS